MAGLVPVFDAEAENRPVAGTMRILDSDSMSNLPRFGPDDHVAVWCEHDTPQLRLRLLAAGVRQVLDADASQQELVRALARFARRSAERSTPAGEPHLDDLHSAASSMRELVEDARQLVHSESSLLLTGETGVGKEHLARAIHAAGPRAGEPFLVVNCGALPESLLESHLFGHERGAFTGADRARPGFFEAADGGTILLDEIGEMPAHLQVKLLTVLERRELVRLGAQEPISVDVRVMAATNRDIRREVARGAFREDLFYRLNVIHLEVPPLRQRTEDLPELAGRLLCDLLEQRANPTRFAGIEESALQALLSYHWPGNVRELRNVLERSLVLGHGPQIMLDDLPKVLRAPGPDEIGNGHSGNGHAVVGLAGLELDGAPPSADGAEPQGGAPANGAATLDSSRWQERTLREVRDEAVAAVEEAYLRHLLTRTSGRVGKTAELAGLRPRSLYDKMKLYGLRKELFKER